MQLAVAFDLRSPTFLPRAKSLGISPRGLRMAEIPVAPPALQVSIGDPWVAIHGAIAAAYAQLEPDEDDLAVADEFPLPTDETKLTARILAIRIVRAAYKLDPSHVVVPRFGAGGGGGVALHWRNENAELLISVPRDRMKRITFYGETKDGSSVEGAFDTADSVVPLAQWLINNELGR